MDLIIRLFTIFLVFMLVVWTIVSILATIPMVPLILFACMVELIGSLPGGEDFSKAFCSVMSFLGNHAALTIILAVVFFLMVFFLEDLFNVLIRAIWLTALLYSIYPSKIILILVILYSISSLAYNWYNSKLSQVVYIGAASPIAFMFFYLILGMILHRNYDYIFYYTENPYPTLVLLGLIVLFVLSFVFFYKMCKITAPGRILYFIPDKIEKVLYKPCVITSFICVLVLIATVLMGSYMNGVFADNIMTIKIVSILSVCFIIFIIEFITSRSVWKGCGIVKNR